MNPANDFFFQIFLALLGIFAGASIPLLAKHRQKAIAGFLFFVLTSVGVTWALFQYFGMDDRKTDNIIQEAYPSLSTVLSMIYPDATLQTEKGIYLTKPLSDTESQIFNLNCGVAEIHPIFHSTYKQNGENLFIILNQIQGCENVCHACSPTIAGATFIFQEGEWVLKTNQLFITNKIGEWGTIPEGSGTLVQIWPEQYAVSLDVSYGQMGVSYNFRYLIAEVGNEIREIFSTKIGGSYPYCESGCWEFSAYLEYVQSSDSAYYDISITRYGTDYLLDGVQDVSGEEYYIFNGQEYIQVR